jgi:hypothetical protein
VPVISDVGGDLRDLPWPALTAAKRAAEIGEPRPGLAVKPVPFSFLACAVLTSLADLQADGLAPSWLVRVGTCLALHFPGDNLGLCLGRPGLVIWELGRPGLVIWELGRPGLVIWELGRPGLVIWELGRRLFAALPVPAAKKTHSAAKKTHGVIIGR